MQASSKSNRTTILIQHPLHNICGFVPSLLFPSSPPSSPKAVYFRASNSFFHSVFVAPVKTSIFIVPSRLDSFRFKPTSSVIPLTDCSIVSQLSSPSSFSNLSKRTSLKTLILCLIAGFYTTCKHKRNQFAFFLKSKIRPWIVASISVVMLLLALTLTIPTKINHQHGSSSLVHPTTQAASNSKADPIPHFARKPQTYLVKTLTENTVSNADQFLNKLIQRKRALNEWHDPSSHSVASSPASHSSSALAYVQLPRIGDRQNKNTSISSTYGVSTCRYSDLWTMIKKRKLLRVIFTPNAKKLLAIDKTGNRYRIDCVPPDPGLIPALKRYRVDIIFLPIQKESGQNDILFSLIFPFITLIFASLFLRQILSAMNSPFEIQKSGARVSIVPCTGVTFQDVAGIDSARTELEEIVQFLRESERFTELGAKIPRGVILEGPPGTGKTLLARAIAGEAGVPFFSISGSEFVEMFVGVGASRVRDLFNQAKKNAPSLIFIDEIDAVGRQRGAGVAGGNDEREQTLNQLLIEMDGFESNGGVIVIAATNRADVLDAALLRPGRFDRRIVVGLPDFAGRLQILKVHARDKPLSKIVDLESLARRTAGFSGAFLQNLLNEAAIFAARENKTTIEQEHVDSAYDRVTVGPTRIEQSVSRRRQTIVAYHEAGHAIVASLVPDYDQITKITIIPRGNAGGLTMFAPDENRVDTGLYSRKHLEGQLAVALGGRLAEEIIFGEEEVTTGASNDLEQVSKVARQMVTRFGFSERVGPVVVDDSASAPFMGREMAGGSEIPPSSKLKTLVDAEVTKLVKRAYDRAKAVLLANRGMLDELAEMLLERESVSASELQALIAKSDVKMMRYDS